MRDDRHSALRSGLVRLLLLCAPLWFAAGCAAPRREGGPVRRGIQTKPSLYTVGRAELAEGPIELPQNYNEEHYRQIIMAVSFQKASFKAGEISTEVAQTVSARLETEMGKLKRFTVFSLHNKGGMRILKNLSAIGEANITVPEGDDLPGIELVLNGALTISKEHHERFSHNEIIYEVECDFHCQDVKTQTLKFAEEAMGRSKRTYVTSLTGEKMGGFDENEEEQAIYEAAMRALSILGNKLGHLYPVGGRVTGMLGDRMQMDRGVEHGIVKGMQMILYTKVSGVDLPIGIAEAQPGPETAALVVWRWNTEDPYAKQVIDEMKSDISWLDGHTLYSCSAGVAIPPEWEKAYSD